VRKSAKVEVRCTPEEKASWVAAAGSKRLSEWLRDLANAADQTGPGAAMRSVAALEKESRAKSAAEVAVPPPASAGPRVTPSRAPIERRPFRPDFKK